MARRLKVSIPPYSRAKGFTTDLKSTAKLSFDDGRVMDMLIKEFERVQVTPTIKDSIACEDFYDGCGCDRCRIVEEMGVHNWPKVRDTK